VGGGIAGRSGSPDVCDRRAMSLDWAMTFGLRAFSASHHLQDSLLGM
jgi:hypothetical protein